MQYYFVCLSGFCLSANHSMKEIIDNCWRYLFGILLGVALLLFVIAVWPNTINKVNDKVLVVDTTQIPISLKEINDKEIFSTVSNLKTESSVNEEKLNSFNSRLGDFYIFIGILVTLLLAINVSVYIKTPGEVEKYMKKNFASH